MRRIRHVAALGGLIVAGGLGVIGILIGTGTISTSGLASFLDTTAGMVILLALAAALLLIGMHYVVILADRRLNAVVYSRSADLGNIEVTPHAVKELIAGILRDEIGISRFRISLHHAGQGVAIHVRTTLSSDQRVTEVSERIQRQLTHYVTERTGVEVRSVAVQVRSIRQSASAFHSVGGDSDAD
jgi:uncharacterized alkaline shock family protein YloU